MKINLPHSWLLVELELRKMAGNSHVNSGEVRCMLLYVVWMSGEAQVISVRLTSDVLFDEFCALVTLSKLHRAHVALGLRANAMKKQNR